MQQIQQNYGPLFTIGLAEDGVQILERALNDGDRLALLEQGFAFGRFQPGAQVFDDAVGYRKGLIGEGDHAQHAAGGADAVPVVVDSAQVDEKVTGKQRLLGGDSLPVADLLDRVLRAVAGEQLVAEVLFSPDFLSWLALNKIPSCCGRALRHCNPLSSLGRGGDITWPSY